MQSVLGPQEFPLRTSIIPVVLYSEAACQSVATGRLMHFVHSTRPKNSACTVHKNVIIIFLTLGRYVPEGV